MIYTFNEQVKMIIYFILLGIYISIMFDTINTLFSKIKIANYILQFVSWIFVTIICLRYIDNISNGYFPIYIVLFFIIGYIIYKKFLGEYYIKILLKLKGYKKVITLALFPITLYNYIIDLIKKIIKKKEENNEKSDINIIDITNDDSTSRV